jgi:hypothetical protein
MTDRQLAAAFYLPHGRAAEPIEALLDAAGATEVAAGSAPVSGLVLCSWAGMTCRAYLSAGVLVLYFPQTSFLQMLDDDLADGLLASFEQACETLRPDAAIIATRLDHADPVEVLHLSGAVLEADARRLAAARFGLLYVSDELADYQDAGWISADREVIPTVGGRLIFGGAGSKRWW